MRFPIIKVRDKETNTQHIVGTDRHDKLIINENGEICYQNIQNGEGTGKFGDCSFEGKMDDEYGLTVEFVSFEELKQMYEDQENQKEKSKKLREQIFGTLFEEN